MTLAGERMALSMVDITALVSATMTKTATGGLRRADARHEGDSSHSLANCDGGVVCSALLVPMAEGSFRYLFRVQETPASVPHVPDLLSPVIDPPPPKLSA